MVWWLCGGWELQVAPTDTAIYASTMGIWKKTAGRCLMAIAIDSDIPLYAKGPSGVYILGNPAFDPKLHSLADVLLE